MTIEEAIKHCEDVVAGETEQGKCSECTAEHKQLAGWLRELLALRAQKYGRWDGEGDGYAETADGEMALVYDVWRCSQCGHTIDDGTDDPELLPNYCPNCGAKMDKEDGGCLTPYRPAKLDMSRWEAHPVTKQRPYRSEKFKEVKLSEDGEVLYRKVVTIHEDWTDDYCSACGKKLCSCFTSYCPNCGRPLTEEAWTELERRITDET